MSHNADETLTLASILSDLGAECCEKATLVDVLTQLGPSMANKEQQIARALFMMCIVREENPEAASNIAHWDASVFLLAVREAFPSIDFSQVLLALDFAHFTIKSPSAAEALLAAFKAVYHVQALSLIISSLPSFRISTAVSLSNFCSGNGLI